MVFVILLLQPKLYVFTLIFSLGHLETYVLEMWLLNNNCHSNQSHIRETCFSENTKCCVCVCVCVCARARLWVYVRQKI